MPHPLLTPTNNFDRAAILHRAWTKARNAVRADIGKPGTWTLRQHFASALRFVWDEARAARGYVLWAVEQDAAHEAAKLVDARTREVQSLRFERTAAIGIESTPLFLATTQAINSRLAQLGA